MKKVKFSKKLAAAICAVTAVSLLFAGTHITTSAADTAEVLSCGHSGTYTEPVPTSGYYFLGGDINNVYFFVNGGKIKLCGDTDDIRDFLTDVCGGCEDAENISVRALDFLTEEQPYTVETMHGLYREEISPSYEVKFIHVPNGGTDGTDINESSGFDIMLIDERTLSFGDVFFCLKGENGDAVDVPLWDDNSEADNLQPCGVHSVFDSYAPEVVTGFYVSDDPDFYFRVYDNKVELHGTDEQIRNAAYEHIHSLSTETSFEESGDSLDFKIEDSPNTWSEPNSIYFVHTMHYAPDDKYCAKWSDRTMICFDYLDESRVPEGHDPYQPYPLIYEPVDGINSITFGNTVFRYVGEDFSHE